MRVPGVALVNARPRRPRSALKNVLIGWGCIGLFGLLILGRTFTGHNTTFGGFIIIGVLIGTWLLPFGLAAVVAAAAMVVPFVNIYDGTVDTFTGRFQFIAVVVTTVLIELVVRASLRAEAEERNASEILRAFAADAAHELRTPLTAMRSDLSTSVKTMREASDMHAALERALGNTERLIRVAEAMLTVARGDAGLLQLRREPLDLADVAEEGMARWKGHADTVGVDLKQDVVGNGSIVADRMLLDRLVDNLVENAIRHTPEKGSVTIEVHRQGADWELAVADTGTGIPAELRPTLFERFSRGSDGSSATGGAGIGLALCRAIARAHGGGIEIDSGTVTGTRIGVRLPVAAGSASV